MVVLYITNAKTQIIIQQINLNIELFSGPIYFGIERFVSEIEDMKVNVTLELDEEK